MTDGHRLAREPLASQPSRRSARRAAGEHSTSVIRSLVPVVLALVAGAILLAALGRNPSPSTAMSGGTASRSGDTGSTAPITMAPFLLIATGLTVIFRANIWNLGYNGQFLLAAAFVAGLGPSLTHHLPLGVAFAAPLPGRPGTAGPRGRCLPALLKARYGTNEIITTLMMSFIGVDLASLLIKGPFQDPAVQTPQTQRDRPSTRCSRRSPARRIHVSLLVAFGAVVVVHFLLTRTAFGLRLQIMGANPRAARHVGIEPAPPDHHHLPHLAVSSSASPRAVDFLSLWGYVRAGQIPTYGDADHPLRLPRAAQRARRRPLRRLLRGALHRRRPRHDARRTCPPTSCSCSSA